MIKSFFLQIKSVLNDKREICVFALIVFLGLMLYSQSLSAPFVYDDFTSIVNNHVIKHIHLTSLWNFDASRFFSNFTFALNYKFFKLNVYYWHLVNILLHSVTAFLIYKLILIIAKTPTGKDSIAEDSFPTLAIGASLLFLIHPIQTQSVIYTVQRATLLSSFFYIATLYSYLKARINNDDSVDYINAIIFSILGSLSKPLFITIPLIVLLSEIAFFKKEEHINIKRLLVFIALCLPVLGIPFWLLGITELQILSLKGLENISFFDRLLTQPFVILMYLRLFLFPINQNLDYDLPIVTEIFSIQFLIPFCSIGALLWLSIQYFKKFRIVCFSFLWFIITLSPVILFPLSDVIFEHWLYLPTVGLSILTLFVLLKLMKTRRQFNLTSIVILCIFALLSADRALLWTNEQALLNDIIKKSPNKVRAFNNLGLLFYRQKNFEEAKRTFQRALRVDENYFFAKNNLANVYLDEGKVKEAKGIFEQLARDHPQYSDPIISLGFIYIDEQNYEMANFYYNTALQIAPFNSAIYLGRGNMFKQLGQLQKAKVEFQRVIFLRPENSFAYYNLANVYVEEKNYYEALFNYEQAVLNQPDLAQAHNNIGSIYYYFSDHKTAIEKFNEAILYNPRLAEGYYNLANAYHAAGELEKADEHIRIALRLYEENGDIKKVERIKKVLESKNDN